MVNEIIFGKMGYRVGNCVPLLLASGEGKREAMRMLLDGNVSEDFPASLLHNHSNVTVIADEAALAGLYSSITKLQLRKEPKKA
ncbi:hypothetical protein M670_03828 [Schinkia azotoformans MEV2011]|uniref:Glucosamine-6-phosphate deaminase n=1 Tax=Schinkia azotoformans MEV2011 TaxID=1348973 RepID=A0A072NGS5_SCHAZ|nr:hypothetical protein M670_03828 [Schinkia azotoformans MEV2011]